MTAPTLSLAYFLETVLLSSLNRVCNGTKFSSRNVKLEVYRISRIKLCTKENMVERRQKQMFYQSERVHKRQRDMRSSWLSSSLGLVCNGTMFSGRNVKLEVYRISRIKLCTKENMVERRQKFRFYQSERVHERQREGGQAGSACSLILWGKCGIIYSF